MKNKKAEEIDNIVIDMLKNLGEKAMITALQRLFVSYCSLGLQHVSVQCLLTR